MTKNDSVRQGAPNLHHPDVAAVLTEEAARLRARARALKATPPPPPPAGNDKTETFAKLWAEQWRIECGVAADRLDDAAHVLEEHLKHPGATQLLLDWQKR